MFKRYKTAHTASERYTRALYAFGCTTVCIRYREINEDLCNKIRRMWGLMKHYAAIYNTNKYWWQRKIVLPYDEICAAVKCIVRDI